MDPTPSQVIVKSDTHDITATPKKSEADIIADRRMRQASFDVAMAAVIVVGIGAAFLAFIADDVVASAATREWSRSVLSAIVGGVVGLAFAKK